MNFHKV